MARTLLFEVEPAEAEVLRLLGFREGRTVLEPPMRRVLDEARALALPLLRAEVSYVSVAPPFEPLFSSASRLVLGVATIGAALEERTDELLEAREWTRALILDAYGSAAAEEAVVR